MPLFHTNALTAVNINQYGFALVPSLQVVSRISCVLLSCYLCVLSFFFVWWLTVSLLELSTTYSGAAKIWKALRCNKLIFSDAILHEIFNMQMSLMRLQGIKRNPFKAQCKCCQWPQLYERGNDLTQIEQACLNPFKGGGYPPIPLRKKTLFLGPKTLFFAFFMHF